MHTKLTLRMDAGLIRTAKSEAGRRGKSVSQIVGEFFDSLASDRRVPAKHPPITTSLIGVLKAHGASESDYRKHLREKYS